MQIGGQSTDDFKAMSPVITSNQPVDNVTVSAAYLPPTNSHDNRTLTVSSQTHADSNCHRMQGFFQSLSRINRILYVIGARLCQGVSYLFISELAFAGRAFSFFHRSNDEKIRVKQLLSGLFVTGYRELASRPLDFTGALSHSPAILSRRRTFNLFPPFLILFIQLPVRYLRARFCLFSPRHVRAVRDWHQSAVSAFSFGSCRARDLWLTRR